ncbi:arsenic resistance protein [Brevibacterium casei]|uniref:arsenic resistance protein n=1 Tax=Brevibacterium casei TaxID=33889 RepID=UPI00191A638F|nr:bile acid:sodium symporter [Brevibacterium casei]QQT68349.1 arsenic resistance protein [Brevibacterium casei]
MSTGAAAVSEWLTRHTAPACLGAIVIGVLLGTLVPGPGEAASVLVTPALVVLLVTTFTEIPLERLTGMRGGGRFAVTVLVLNFVLVPLVVAGLHWAIPLASTIVVAVLIVLLAPCIDYVIVFTGLAGGASARLLALTPVLMVVQIVLLPVWLRLILGERATVLITPGPFLAALVTFIVVPLLAALVLRLLARRSACARRTLSVSEHVMMPVMLLTLIVITAAEVRTVLPYLPDLGPAVLACVLFAAVMVGLGWAIGRVVLADGGERRALVFTGVTRNSLVVLPLVRAVDREGPGTAAVVTQTLVELVVMAVLVWLVPRMVPSTAMSENR